MDTKGIERSVRVAADIARNVSDELYGYYLTLRGPSLGAMPDGSVGMLSYDQRTYHETICERVLGWVCYARPLTPEEVRAYELVPDENNHYIYDQYYVEIRKLVVDAAGKKHLTSERAKDPDGGNFLTRYQGKAKQVADAINEAALDTNSSTNLTHARVRKYEV